MNITIFNKINVKQNRYERHKHLKKNLKGDKNMLYSVEPQRKLKRLLFRATYRVSHKDRVLC